MMAYLRTLLTVVVSVVALGSCQNAEEAFIGDRLLSVCDEAYYICNKYSGCVLDSKHYSEGGFPGTQRVVVETDEAVSEVTVRLFLSEMDSPGTQIILQLYEPDCTVDKQGYISLEDVDIFEEAGDDRTLTFEFDTYQEGEHLLEIYSDAAAEYLLVVEAD